MATLWLMLCNVTETKIFKGLSAADDFSRSSRADAEQGLDSMTGSFGRTDVGHAGPEYSKERQGSSSLGGYLKTMVQCGRLQSAAGARKIL